MSVDYDWLNLIEISGPFLAVPVLRSVFPQGFERLDTARASRLRSAYEEWRDAIDGEDSALPMLHKAWIKEVLRTALDADESMIKSGDHLPTSAISSHVESGHEIKPEIVFVDPTRNNAVLLHLHVFPPDTELDSAMKFDGLTSSPAERMVLHLRATGKALGIVTNGERWMLVHAPVGQISTFASWYARIWGQEPETLRAFSALLGARRFFAPEQERLPALFAQSLRHQDDVTDALGEQVRNAVEVLVRSLDRADQDRNRELLRDISSPDLYEAGLTVMMRLVFLLAAEERGLLLLGEPRYDSFYAVSTLRMQLRGENDEILERRYSAWSRLLAVFRGIYGGIDHPTMLLPAMGGSLFDPDRFPFLEGRAKHTSWRQHEAEPLPIDDATVLLLLEAIQTFEGRTLSYRALDVEQIGHVYEGLLERTVERAEDGALSVVMGTTRRESGTHYTPKSLTERIVEETLTPLVYEGPAVGTPKESWVLQSAAEILDLKVCDLAMGSGAFLVQVCRFLSMRLVEAWTIAEASGSIVDVEGQVYANGFSGERLPASQEERAEYARRLVAERCLYGVDKNPLAVELAKLSLWLVTLAKGRPFGFLDHNLRCGDSLLGIHDLRQLTELSMRPGERTDQLIFARNINEAMQHALDLRRQLREIPIRDIHDVENMASLDAVARTKIEMPKKFADAFIGTVFAEGNSRTLNSKLVGLAGDFSRIINGDADTATAVISKAALDLAKDSPNGQGNITFHWPLEFPEIFLRENSGFDAIVGNPPFRGGRRISGDAGSAYRDWLVAQIADGRRGSADLVAYFFLRAWNLLRDNSGFGLLAVNTIAEGDTRQVGLEAMTAAGAIIHAAYPNEPWPGRAAVITSRIHARKGNWHGLKSIHSRPVSFISAYLSDQEEWSPKQLKANKGIAFQGSIVLGMGFVLTPDEARQMLDADPKNIDVIFPYLSGDDLNTNPNQDPSRWVINFWDWSEDRAQAFAEPWKWIEERVKPERQRRGDDGNYVLRRPLPERWWHYADKRPALYHTIGRGHRFESHPPGWNAGGSILPRVLVAARVGKYFNPSIIDSGVIFHEKCVVFTVTNVHAYAALFNSSIAEIWVWKQSSRLGISLNFSPSDAMETLPLPMEIMPALDNLGIEYMRVRSEAMTQTETPIGLTKLYNRFHNANDSADVILRMRKIHCEIDEAVMRAYGWDDINLNHGFHSLPFLPENDRIRFTVTEEARIEILHRLSALNQQRYQEEVSNGLHEPRQPTRSSNSAASTASQEGFNFEGDQDEPVESVKQRKPRKQRKS